MLFLLISTVASQSLNCTQNLPNYAFNSCISNGLVSVSGQPLPPASRTPEIACRGATSPSYCTAAFYRTVAGCFTNFCPNDPNAAYYITQNQQNTGSSSGTTGSVPNGVSPDAYNNGAPNQFATLVQPTRAPVFDANAASTVSVPLIFSRVTLVGRMGQNPEFVPFNYPKEDSKYQGSWKFSLATTKSVKKGEEYETETMWHSITTLRSLKNIGKGSMVLVEGEFKYWQTEDNAKKGVTIVANTVRVLDGKSVDDQE